MGLEGKAKVVVYEIIGAFVLILLLVVLRPLFVGQVASAGSPYTITLQNGSTETITPSTTLSASNSDTLYTIAIFIVSLIAVVVIIMTTMGKL